MIYSPLLSGQNRRAGRWFRAGIAIGDISRVVGR